METQRRHFSIMIVYKIDSITKMKVKDDHRSKCSNLIKQLERRSLKKILASMGFEPVTSAIPVRCSTN